MHRICGVEMVLGSGNGVELRIDDDDERGEERTGGEISLLCCAVLCWVVEREVDVGCVVLCRGERELTWYVGSFRLQGVCSKASSR